LDAEFSAEWFFIHRRMNAISVLAARNDWFQKSEITEVIAAIRAATPGFELVGYGGSMGAYAVINFADLLGLRSVLAVCPQFSIDSARAGYEPRWRTEAAAIEADGGFAFDRIDRVSRLTKGWLVFDPGCTDGLHARDIQRHHALPELRLRFGGHDMMRMLQQADLFTDMILDMLEGRFEPVSFRRRWRAARRRSAVYWLAVSAALLRRGNAAAALRAIAEARLLPHPETAEIDVAEARIRLASREAAAASSLAEKWADHPIWGEAAQACLSQCRPPPAPVRPKIGMRLRSLLRACWRKLRP
jgi:hypothetical protein